MAMDLAEGNMEALVRSLSLKDQYIIWASLQNRKYEEDQKTIDLELAKVGQKPKQLDHPFLIK